MPGKKRKFLPKGLTKFEKKCPKYRKRLSSCIRQVEKKIRSKTCKPPNYKKCPVNPVSVCRAKVKKIC